MKTNWARQGVLNTLEHLLSRGLDAFATIAVLWFVPTEKFSLLALSQAFVAPILFLFVSPETVLYPKFALWQSGGLKGLSRRIRILRRFAWGKLFAAFVFSGIIAFAVAPPNGTAFSLGDRFFALLWAFSLPLATQIAGPDREYLRLSLGLRALNVLTLLQRAIYVGMLFLTVTFFEVSFEALAAAGLISVVITAGVSRWYVEQSFVACGKGIHGIRFWPLIAESLRDFSIWNHIAGVIAGWVQTLDLFFLGVFGAPAREIGTYSVVLKISNFALAIPSALSNLYLVRLGREGAKDSEGATAERRELVRLSLYLGAAATVGALMLWAVAPLGLSYLSRGRWDADEQLRMIEWLRSIIPASALYAAFLLWTGWLSIRRSFRSLVNQVYIPWGVISVGTYALAVKHGGADWAAPANLVVVLALGALLILFSRHKR